MDAQPTTPVARGGAGATHCRFCGTALERTFVNLGMAPPCERFLTADQLEEAEPFFPLHVRVCDACNLVQLPELVSVSEIFDEYAYFSSYSSSWVEHARRYVQLATDRLELTKDSFVVELASNDGYLLQHFHGTGVRILGVDPAHNVAEAAVARGVPTLVEFFNRAIAHEIAANHGRADLIVANNVLAQVPDLNEFVSAVPILLALDGTATFEFPHLLHLIRGIEYDTIYHEHFSYFWFHTAVEVLEAHGLDVYDVEELPSHGGSLRVWAGHPGSHERSPQVERLLALEADSGLTSPEASFRFAEDVSESKRALLDLLVRLRREGRRVAGYGAPGKGNTLLNYCGIRADFLDYTVDRNPYKHGRFLPGSHIPVFPPEHLEETRPDYILVLPWNLLDEISRQLSYVARWGAKLIVPIPTATIVSLAALGGLT